MLTYAELEERCGSDTHLLQACASLLTYADVC
jgi:hypothetical protein